MLTVREGEDRVVDDRREVGAHAAGIHERHAPVPALDAETVSLGVAVQRREEMLEQQRRALVTAVAGERSARQTRHKVDVEAFALGVHRPDDGAQWA